METMLQKKFIFYLQNTPIDFIVYKNVKCNISDAVRDTCNQFPILWFLSEQWICARKTDVAIHVPHIPLYIRGTRCLYFNSVNLCTLFGLKEDAHLELIIGLWLRLTRTYSGFGKLRKSLWYYIVTYLNSGACSNLLLKYNSHSVLTLEVYKFFEIYNTKIARIDLRIGLPPLYLTFCHDPYYIDFFAAIDFTMCNELSILRINNMIRVVTFPKKTISFCLYNKTLFCKEYPCLSESAADTLYTFYKTFVFIPTMSLYSTPHNFLASFVCENTPV